MRALQPGDPERLGGHDLLGRLGEGGQGTVYLGRGPHGEVAVKLLHARLSDDPVARARFARELATLRRIAGFCTARVHAADLDGDRPYIVSEYVPGPSLRELVLAEGPRTEGALMRLAVGTATALAAIHGAGVVHRDFKPPNVLMAPDGPRVIDFGIARALDNAGMRTMTGQLVGTPAYMAPEQFAGSSVGPAADLFAWAHTVAFAATGRNAFGSGTLMSLIHAIRTAEPDLAGVPPELLPLLQACLAKDPTSRPTSQDLLWTLLTLVPPPRPYKSTSAPPPPDAHDVTHDYAHLPPPHPNHPRTAPNDGPDPRSAPTPPPQGPTGPEQGAPGPSGFQGHHEGPPHHAWDHHAGGRGVPGQGGRGFAPKEGAGEGVTAWEGAARPVGAVRRGRPPGRVSADDPTQDLGGRRVFVRRAQETPAQPEEEAGRAPLRRTWPLALGLLLVTAVSLLDMASLSVVAGGPVVETRQQWTLVLATAYTSLAVITLFGVAAAWRGYRSGVWTIIAVRLARAGTWILTLGQVPPHDLTLVLQTVSPVVVIVLLLAGLYLGRDDSRRR
ncbi:serine/threonine protein kinase [Actinocorallia herbida]|uniref:Serine/threonine protein kinase n=1 Tax=Actinocorallia herbida TaxID=58109 RepID=A0A3N1D5V7_9ACTN|nr:serine/threonine-protein kinase [Actinocorallia herbida]ROO88942.1 serine/threonine protein kinase [Actinocorallia herbida]